MTTGWTSGQRFNAFSFICTVLFSLIGGSAAASTEGNWPPDSGSALTKCFGGGPPSCFEGTGGLIPVQTQRMRVTSMKAMIASNWVDRFRSCPTCQGRSYYMQIRGPAPGYAIVGTSDLMSPPGICYSGSYPGCSGPVFIEVSASPNAHDVILEPGVQYSFRLQRAGGASNTYNWVATRGTANATAFEVTLTPYQPCAAIGDCAKLYLDADGDNISDTSTWVPEWDASLQAFKAVNILLALQESFVQPGVQATFELLNTTAYRGLAMNGGPDTGPDYAFAAGTSVVTVAFGPPQSGVCYAQVVLLVNDAGGSATIRCTANTTPALDETLVLPVDPNGDKLPAYYEATLEDMSLHSVWGEAIAACSDDDKNPPGDGQPGDGLTAFEEYRGFFFDGRHVRLDPFSKDYFYYLVIGNEANGSMGVLAPDAEAVRNALPTNDNVVALADVSPSGYINGNRPWLDPPCFTNRKAVRVEIDYTNTDLGPPGGTVAENSPCTDFLIPPDVSAIRLYASRMRFANPPTTGTSASVSVSDESDQRFMNWCALHEMGHSMNLVHFTPYPDLCPYGCEPAGGFPFTTTDLCTGDAPSFDPFVRPHGTQRRGSVVPACAPTDPCGKLRQGGHYPPCDPVPPGSPYSPPVKSPTAACGPGSAMASSTIWWARPTCGMPLFAESPWSDPCTAGALYWQNLDLTFDDRDLLQLRLTR